MFYPYKVHFSSSSFSSSSRDIYCAYVIFNIHSLPRHVYMFVFGDSLRSPLFVWRGFCLEVFQCNAKSTLNLIHMESEIRFLFKCFFLPLLILMVEKLISFVISIRTYPNGPKRMGVGISSSRM